MKPVLLSLNHHVTKKMPKFTSQFHALNKEIDFLMINIIISFSFGIPLLRKVKNILRSSSTKYTCIACFINNYDKPEGALGYL